VDEEGFGLRLRRRLKELYFGDSPRAIRFRVAWIVLDLTIIGFFIAAHAHPGPTNFPDRGLQRSPHSSRPTWPREHTPGTIFQVFLGRAVVWLDIVVLLTLIFPAFYFNIGFLLRFLRLWTLFNSDVFLENDRTALQ
jgi:voltage-gated potassium channel